MRKLKSLHNAHKKEIQRIYCTTNLYFPGACRAESTA